MKNILCFAAHPDDLEFSCTGALHRLIAQDFRVYYVIITNGENGFKQGTASPEERIEIRKREQQAAADLLGVEEVIFLGYRDGFLEYTDTLRSQLTSLIKTYQPEIVFSFDPANRAFDNINLYHRDHRIAAEAVFDACFAAKNDWMYPGKSHRIQTIYFYGSTAPNYFCDISSFMPRKLEILACHASQFPDFKKVEHFIVEGLSKQSPEFTYSEAFRLLHVEQLT